MATASIVHVTCYRDTYKREPLRSFAAKERRTCPMCETMFPQGTVVAYDVAPPGARRASVPAVPAATPVPEETTTMHETTPVTPESVTPAPAVEPGMPTPDVSGVLRALGAILQPMIDASVRAAVASTPAPATVDTDAVKRIVVEHMATLDRPTRIEIVDKRDGADATPVDLGLTHECFPKLLDLVRRKRHVWLHGPAGTGKTFVASQVAAALGLTYRMQGAIADRYADLLGFIRITDGAYQRTQYRESFEHGGCHLIDEIDGSTDPGSPLAINATLANHRGPFPDGLVTRHEDFRVIAAANTKGLGADATYVGRVRFDGAFLDRFTPLYWPIDEKLERALWPNAAKRVQEIRRRVEERGVKVLITPRASERLASVLGSDVFSEEEAERVCIGGLMTDEQWRQVR